MLGSIICKKVYIFLQTYFRTRTAEGAVYAVPCFPRHKAHLNFSASPVTKFTPVRGYWCRKLGCKLPRDGNMQWIYLKAYHSVGSKKSLCHLLSSFSQVTVLFLVHQARSFSFVLKPQSPTPPIYIRHIKRSGESVFLRSSVDGVMMTFVASQILSNRELQKISGRAAETCFNWLRSWLWSVFCRILDE